jgi:hypothetical protein
LDCRIAEAGDAACFRLRRQTAEKGVKSGFDLVYVTSDRANEDGYRGALRKTLTTCLHATVRPVIWRRNVKHNSANLIEPITA